jgi:hypothetical protein
LTVVIGPLDRVKVSPSLLGYSVAALGAIMGALVPSTLVGLPGPGAYNLANYHVIPFVPLAPMIGVAVGIATVWAANHMASAKYPLALLSSGFLLTVALFWVSYYAPAHFVSGLGFPLSWLMAQTLPLRPPVLVGTSVVAFLVDWGLFTALIDSIVFARERSRIRADRFHSRGSH